MGLRDKIAAAVPWIEPVLDYFDWRKRFVAIAAGVGLAMWSFVKDLPWPVIVVLGAAAMVIVAYALVFPAFLKLVHVGVEPRPNNSIWRHRKEFLLYQAAYLLADHEPIRDPAALRGDSAAWFGVLHEAVSRKEIAYIPSQIDGKHTFGNEYHPHFDTKLSAEEVKKFCQARHRKPEFLDWT
ncbi:MAG: hypothetical protein WBD95_01160 [Xanthobacteraceae bacterium]